MGPLDGDLSVSLCENYLGGVERANVHLSYVDDGHIDNVTPPPSYKTSIT